MHVKEVPICLTKSGGFDNSKNVKDFKAQPSLRNIRRSMARETSCVCVSKYNFGIKNSGFCLKPKFFSHLANLIFYLLSW